MPEKNPSSPDHPRCREGPGPSGSVAQRRSDHGGDRTASPPLGLAQQLQQLGDVGGEAAPSRVGSLVAARRPGILDVDGRAPGRE